MSSRLFKRTGSLVVAKVDADRYFTTTTEITIEELRLAFSIEKHLGKEPNTCTISIYNLNEQSRAELQHHPLQVRLEAGYDGERGRLFAGDLYHSATTREGPDVVTKLQVADGRRAYKHARVNRSFKPGTDARTVLKDIAGSMGLKVPKDVDEAKELAAQFASGVVAHGPSRKELTRVLARSGMDWSIQDGRLQILRTDGIRADEAILVNQDTGLVGSPTYGTPKKHKGRPPLNFRMLLYPGMTPGGKARVQSEDVDGLFKIQRVKHEGDTETGDFFTDVEALQI